jgi:Tfp pilus assembly protein PilX
MKRFGSTIILALLLCGMVFGCRHGQSSVGVRLRWDLSRDTQVVGYNVYRASHPGGEWKKVNRKLVRAPYYHDKAGGADGKSVYRVTAVGVSGKESDFSNMVEYDRD